MEDKGMQPIKVGKLTINEDDLRIRVQYNGEMFVMRYPTPADKAQIEVDIARTLGGLPRSSFSEDYIFQVEATTYVANIAIMDECPEWFKNAWTCYDEALIVTLYGEYLTFRKSFREKLTTGGLEKRS